MVFSMSMFVVYGDANSDVINKRNEIDKIKVDIKAKKSVVTTLESEENYWNDRLTVVEDILKQREDLEDDAKQDYEVALRNKVQTVEDIEFIEAIKKTWETTVVNVTIAQVTVTQNKKDLENFEQRLIDARILLRALEKSLPEAEDDIEDLIIIANRALPITVYGTQRAIIITIILSDTCLVSDTCPTYLDLANVYDNSNRYISGEFFKVDSGYTRPIYSMVECEGNCSSEATLQKVGDEEIMIWKRGLPLYAENTIGWYEYSAIPVLTFVDPDDQTRVVSREIIIEPTLPEGFNRSLGFNKSTNYTITYGVDRYINGCHNAVIGWSPHGDELLADTWNYFYNKCSVATNFNDTVSTYFPPTEFTDCHRWCEHLKWVAKAKIIAKTFFTDRDLR